MKRTFKVMAALALAALVFMSCDTTAGSKKPGGAGGSGGGGGSEGGGDTGKPTAAEIAAEKTARDAFESIIEGSYKRYIYESGQWKFYDDNNIDMGKALDSTKTEPVYGTYIWTINEVCGEYGDEMDSELDRLEGLGFSKFRDAWNRLKAAYGDDWQTAGCFHVYLTDDSGYFGTYLHEITSSEINMYRSDSYSCDTYYTRALSAPGAGGGDESPAGTWSMDGCSAKIIINSDGTWANDGNEQSGGVSFSGSWTKSGSEVTLSATVTVLDVEEKFELTSEGLEFRSSRSGSGDVWGDPSTTQSYILDNVFSRSTGTLVRQ